MKMDHLISVRPRDLMIDNKNNKKENLPADHKVKLKEIEKRAKYQDLARELKNYET